SEIVQISLQIEHEGVSSRRERVGAHGEYRKNRVDAFTTTRSVGSSTPAQNRSYETTGCNHSKRRRRLRTIGSGDGQARSPARKSLVAVEGFRHIQILTVLAQE